MSEVRSQRSRSLCQTARKHKRDSSGAARMALSPPIAHAATLESARVRNSVLTPQANSRRGAPSAGGDVVFARTGLSVGEVAGTQRPRVFGIEPYIPPKGDGCRYRIPGTADTKKPRQNFAELAAKRKQWVPAPNQFK